jgi:hypothetical protein
MLIIEYTDAYSYACGITLHKHKRTAYAAMRPHFKTMLLAEVALCWKILPKHLFCEIIWVPMARVCKVEWPKQSNDYYVYKNNST